MKKHHLIAPEDYSTAEAAKVEPPTAPKIPGYAQATRAYLGQTKSAESTNRPRPESAPSNGTITTVIHHVICKLKSYTYKYRFDIFHVKYRI